MFYISLDFLDKVKEDKTHGPYSTNGRNEKNRCVLGRSDGLDDEFLREVTNIYTKTKDFISRLENYYYYYLPKLSFHSVAVVLTLVTNNNKYT